MGGRWTRPNERGAGELDSTTAMSSNSNFLDVSTPLHTTFSDLEIDLVRCALPQKAIEIVQKAIDADVKQEYEEAYKQ